MFPLVKNPVRLEPSDLWRSRFRRLRLERHRQSESTGISPFSFLDCVLTFVSCAHCFPISHHHRNTLLSRNIIAIRHQLCSCRAHHSCPPYARSRPQRIHIKNAHPLGVTDVLFIDNHTIATTGDAYRLRPSQDVRVCLLIFDRNLCRLRLHDSNVGVECVISGTDTAMKNNKIATNRNVLISILYIIISKL